MENLKHLVSVSGGNDEEVVVMVLVAVAAEELQSD